MLENIHCQHLSQSSTHISHAFAFEAQLSIPGRVTHNIASWRPALIIQSFKMYKFVKRNTFWLAWNCHYLLSTMVLLISCYNFGKILLFHILARRPPSQAMLCGWLWSSLALNSVVIQLKQCWTFPHLLDCRWGGLLVYQLLFIFRQSYRPDTNRPIYLVRLYNARGWRDLTNIVQSPLSYIKYCKPWKNLLWTPKSEVSWSFHLLNELWSALTLWFRSIKIVYVWCHEWWLWK